MNEISSGSLEEIKKRILTIRGVQVMLDTDLAELYSVETRVLNQAVKRNIDRFPKEFKFQLSFEEYDSLRSQFVTLNKNLLLPKDTDNQTNVLRSQNGTLETGRGKHRKYLPYVFTEQGVAMLSAVLRSDTAVKMSIQIMNAFVAMRHFLISNAQIFQRLDTLEVKQIQTDLKFERVFNALESGQLQPKQGIFFNGQVFDAYKFACDLVRTAKKSILLIDNFVDDTVLDILAKRNKKVAAAVYTKKIGKQLSLDITKHNSQYPPIEVKEFDLSHDRFLIIDGEEVYHIGASLKDLGKKWFAFSKMEPGAAEMLVKLREAGK